MRRQLPRVFCALSLIAVMALPAMAQSTREEWLALRTRKQARHHRLPGPATQPGVFTITVIRFFSDAAGNLVGVGEARNDTSFDLSYSRINFRFLDASGAELGREWTYLHGGVNARIVGNNAYETLLVPGATGFFKVWTTIPASAMSSYTFESTGENLPFVGPRAGGSAARPEDWVPRVFTLGTPRIAEQRISGDVWNDDPLGFQSPSALPTIFTYSVQVSVAAYQDGVISDVQSVTAVGDWIGDACRGEPVTGMGLHHSARFTMDLARPANTVGRYSVEWHETNVSPWLDAHVESHPIGFLGEGGTATFRIERECGWTATSSVPWIRIVDGAVSGRTGGEVTVHVEPNPTSAERTGFIIVSGEAFAVVQGLACQRVLNSTMFLGPGHQRTFVTGAPNSCLWGVRTSESWLMPIVQYDALWVIAEPNFTGATRKAVVTVGSGSIVVYQSPASRNTDFNNDGRLDLLWRHRDGRVAVWRMDGTRLMDGALLSPARWELDMMTPVGAADVDANGSTDVLWQNTLDGTPVLWEMTGTSVFALRWFVSNTTTHSTWKISAMADFNRDGRVDFLWRDQGTGTVFVWLMGTIQRLSTVPLGSGLVADVNWKIAGSGDFNRDGWPDVVWQHETDGRLAVWKMRGTTLLEATLISPGRVSDLDWKIRAVGDMNGDDAPDLIWQHRVDGRVAVWVMNGTTMVAGTVIAQVADTGWEIVGPR